MSEELKPDLTPEAEEPRELTLAQLIARFEEILSDENRMQLAKEAEAVKAAFYKKLIKEKAEAASSGAVSSEDTPEGAEPSAEGPANPFAAVEAGFKELYARFKEERAEYNRKIDEERASNLVAKKAVIEELKELVASQEDTGRMFPEFRALQNRWKEIGPVPAQDFRDLNATYHLYVEQFYDKAELVRDIRDREFAENLGTKEQLCAEAEELGGSDDVVSAFARLQELHDQWKDLGPVAKEFRESIWERFKAATAVINKKYQAHFEEIKKAQAENLQTKQALCDDLDAILAKVAGEASVSWNALTKEVSALQQKWRTIGFATRKENQKIYDRFRAGCDEFFAKKREFFSEARESMQVNLEKKLDIVAQAEALKDSTEWKKTTDKLISLQKQWKEIGAVPRKRSEELWTRFRAACDEFFSKREAGQKQHPAAGRQQERRRPELSEKEKLSRRYAALQQDIDTYENNMGFFTGSASAIIEQMKQKVEDARRELAEIEARLRQLRQDEEAGKE